MRAEKQTALSPCNLSLLTLGLNSQSMLRNSILCYKGREGIFTHLGNGSQKRGVILSEIILCFGEWGIVYAFEDA